MPKQAPAVATALTHCINSGNNQGREKNLCASVGGNSVVHRPPALCAHRYIRLAQCARNFGRHGDRERLRKSTKRDVVDITTKLRSLVGHLAPHIATTDL